MTFQLKDFKSIVASMINYTKATQNKLTDFHVGSVTRTLFESPAIEIDEFYQQVFFGLLDAIPVAIYQAFDFERIPSACASGTVRFTATEARQTALTISSGIKLTSSSDDKVYYTTEEGVIAVGETYVDVHAVAEATGTEYDKIIGEVDQLETSVDGISSVSNITAITGGRDEETDDEMKTRFIDYIQSISRSTYKAVLYASKQATVENDGVVIEYVSQAGIVEAPGHVNIYILGSGGAPSSDLIQNCQTLIDGTYDTETGQYVEGWRPCGVSVVVSAMTNQTVDFTLSIQTTDDSYHTDTMKNTIKSVINSALSTIELGGSMTIAELRTEILNIDGVQRAIIENNANLTRPASKYLTVGTMTVTWL